MESRTLLATVTWAQPRMRRHRKAWGVNPGTRRSGYASRLAWTRPGGLSRGPNALPVHSFLIALLPFSQVFLLNAFVVRHHLKPLHPFARRFVIHSAIPAFFSEISIVVGGFVRSISASLGGFVRRVGSIDSTGNDNWQLTTDH